MNAFARITDWAKTRLGVSEPRQAEGVKMADTTGAAEAVSGVKVAIKGLKDWQCEELEGIEVGSLVEVAVFERVRHADTANGSDGDGNGASDGEGSGEESDEEDEKSEQDGEENEADDSVTPPTLEPTDATAKQRNRKDVTLAQSILLESGFAMNGAATDAAALETDQDNDVLDGAPDLESNASNDQTHAESENGSNNDESEGESADEDEDEGADEVDDQDAEDENDDQDAEDENDDQDAEDDDVEPVRQVSRELYVVLSITTQEGDDSIITDVHLRNLTYQNRGTEANYDTYRIFGNIITLEDGSATLQDGEESHSVAEAIAAEPDNEYAIVLSPGGDQLRRTLFGFVCPGRCNRGWLPDQAALAETISEELETLRHYRPICPVCVGKDLMNEQMLLRSLLDAQQVVDIGMVVEYLGRLNPRRRQLGYSFVQFDEREWGYGFDDMLDGSSDGGDADGAGHYEHWDEAMDPNANPKTRPASKDTVAALPRKMYADVVKKEDGAFCAICQEGVFEEESSVVELPCGHVYDEGCLEAWIKEYDNCPECRATVSGMVEQKKEIKAEEGESEQDQYDEGKENALPSTMQATTVLTGAGEHEAMDGEDTIMSDAVVDQTVAEAAW